MGAYFHITIFGGVLIAKNDLLGGSLFGGGAHSRINGILFGLNYLHV